MSSIVTINGELFDRSTARISVFDHGLLFGDGVVEDLRAFGGSIFRLPRHVERLYASALAIKLAIPQETSALCRSIQEAVDASGLGDAFIRLLVTRGAGSLDLDPRKTTDPQVIIIVDQIGLYAPELYELGLRIVTSKLPPAPNAPAWSLSTLSAMHRVMVKAEAIAAGCLEALIVDQAGKITGGTSGGVFVVKDRGISTPSSEFGPADPVHREAIIELARSAGYSVVERPLDRYDILEADECFLSGTAAMLIPVVECDARLIGQGKPGPITRELRERFECLVRGGRETGDATSRATGINT